MSDLTLVVVKMPAEDYFNRTEGPYALALELADKHGGRSSGGGTDLTTGMSDLDLEVPTANVEALLEALNAAGLNGLCFADDDE
jgi:hypothetical protein